MEIKHQLNFLILKFLLKNNENKEFAKICIRS